MDLRLSFRVETARGEDGRGRMEDAFATGTVEEEPDSKCGNRQSVILEFTCSLFVKEVFKNVLKITKNKICP